MIRIVTRNNEKNKLTRNYSMENPYKVENKQSISFSPKKKIIKNFFEKTLQPGDVQSEIPVQ